MKRYSVRFDDNTGLLYEQSKELYHTCDICGYVDATKGKTAVSKGDDDIYRCVVCRRKLGEDVL